MEAVFLHHAATDRQPLCIDKLLPCVPIHDFNENYGDRERDKKERESNVSFNNHFMHNRSFKCACRGLKHLTPSSSQQRTTGHYFQHQ
jgi:hypothetical protein